MAQQEKRYMSYICARWFKSNIISDCKEILKDSISLNALIQGNIHRLALRNKDYQKYPELVGTKIITFIIDNDRLVREVKQIKTECQRPLN